MIERSCINMDRLITHNLHAQQRRNFGSIQQYNQFISMADRCIRITIIIIIIIRKAVAKRE